MSLIKNTATSATATIVGTVGRLLITIHVARTLGPAVFGPLVFTQWCADTLASVSNLGLPNVLTRYCSELQSISASERRDRINLFLIASCGTVSLAAILSACVFWWVGNTTSLSFFILSVGWALSSLTLLLANGTAFGLMRFDLVLLSNVTYVIVGLGAAEAFVKKGSATSAMAAWILAASAAAIVNLSSLMFSRNRSAPIDTVQVSPRGELYRYAFNTWISSLMASILWTRGEIGVLKAQVDSKSIANYGVATTLSGLVMQGVSLFQGAITPHLAADWKRGESRRIEKVLRSLSNLTFLISVTGAYFLVLFSQEFVTIFFGKQFTSASLPLAIIAIGATAAGSGAINMAVQFETHGKFQRDVNFIGAACLIVTAMLLVPHFGIVGAAVGRSVSVAGIGLLVVRRLGSAGYPGLSNSVILRWLLALALVISVCVVVNFVHPSYFVRIMLLIAGICVICALFVRWSELKILWPVTRSNA